MGHEKKSKPKKCHQVAKIQITQIFGNCENILE